LRLFVSLEILRAAVFWWITPFFAAFAMKDFALLRRSEVFSAPASVAACTFFTAVFIEDRVDLFLMRLTSFCFARFLADLWLANFVMLLVLYLLCVG
jgi:hypothetical protein